MRVRSHIYFMFVVLCLILYTSHAALIGGTKRLDRQSESMLGALKFATAELNIKNYEIVRASSQVVSGLLYIMHLQRPSEPATCKIAVLHRAWKTPQYKIVYNKTTCT